jgi:hypothetical protein
MRTKVYRNQLGLVSKYEIVQRIGQLRHRFLYYIVFEASAYPQLAKLAANAADSDQLWTSVIQLLSTFFP